MRLQELFGVRQVDR